MCFRSHAISAKEKSSTGTQQMAKSRKCSLVTPKTQYFNSAFSNCCVSWIWSRAFCPFLQATKFNTAHLVLVAVFLGTNSLPRAASIASSTNCHQLSLSFGTLSFNFFFSGFHLGTSLSVELLSLDLSTPPCLNETARSVSWNASGYLPKVRERSNPRHTTLGGQHSYTFLKSHY